MSKDLPPFPTFFFSVVNTINNNVGVYAHKDYNVLLITSSPQSVSAVEKWDTCRYSAQIKRGSVVEESHNEWPDVLDRWVKRESRTSCWTLDALGLWCDGSWCRKTSCWREKWLL